MLYWLFKIMYKCPLSNAQPIQLFMSVMVSHLLPESVSCNVFFVKQYQNELQHFVLQSPLYHPISSLIAMHLCRQLICTDAVHNGTSPFEVSIYRVHVYRSCLFIPETAQRQCNNLSSTANKNWLNNPTVIVVFERIAIMLEVTPILDTTQATAGRFDCCKNRIDCRNNRLALRQCYCDEASAFSRFLLRLLSICLSLYFDLQFLCGR